MIYDTWKTTKFGQIEVLRQQVRRNLLILLFEGLVVALKEKLSNSTNTICALEVPEILDHICHGLLWP